MRSKTRICLPEILPASQICSRSNSLSTLTSTSSLAARMSSSSSFPFPLNTHLHQSINTRMKSFDYKSIKSIQLPPAAAAAATRTLCCALSCACSIPYSFKPKTPGTNLVGSKPALIASWSSFPLTRTALLPMPRKCSKIFKLLLAFTAYPTMYWVP